MGALIRPFEELGIGLGWRGSTVVGMTWIYFDESGEHSGVGTLRKLTLGCGIASFDSWSALTSEWSRVLENEGVPMWHMADFEARAKPFNDWADDRRKRVLNELLSIAGRHVSLFWGFNDFATDLISAVDFRRAYCKNVVKALKELLMQINELPISTPIKIVFAKHKDISAGLLGRYFDFFSYWLGEKVEFSGFGHPKDSPPLQVADLIAYEFSRTAREKRPIPERYPLLAMAKAANAFTLYHASTIRERTVWGRQLPEWPH